MQTYPRLIALAAALFVLSACATPPSPEPTVTVTEAVPPIEVVEPEAEPGPEPEQAAEVLPAKPPSVALVLTSRNAVYEALAHELGKYFEFLSIYDLSDKSQPPVSAFRLINDGDNDAVIAVGTRAARSAVAMSEQPVVFSYVFNYRENDLLGARSRGVEAIAPLDAQLDAWQEAEPSIESIGLLVGSGHTELVEQARRLAEQRGLRLSVIQANSDQEALYLFKRVVHDIDGFWLLPDNRVLSARSLKNMMSLANRQGVSVLAPSPSMLSIGANISVSPVAADIAARIRDIVERIHGGEIARVIPMTPLTRFRVDTRDTGRRAPVVARRDVRAQERLR